MIYLIGITYAINSTGIISKCAISLWFSISDCYKYQIQFLLKQKGRALIRAILSPGT